MFAEGSPDLMLYLREKNAFTITEVELAVLETNGKMSVMKKADAQPIRPKDLGLNLEQEYKSQIVIMDGNLLENNLKNYGYTKEWLLGEVKKKGANNFTDVFLAHKLVQKEMSMLIYI